MLFDKTHILLITLLILITSCNTKGDEAVPNTKTQGKPSISETDTTAIRLALVPGTDCLPFYIADGLQLDDSLGIPIRITTYFSGIDADTALMGKTVVAGYSDIDRARYHLQRGQWKGLRQMWQTDECYQLIRSPKLRIRDIRHLKGRMIATERFAASDFWLHEALKSGDVSYDKTYHPQIGDLVLRTSMLIAGQIDAAMLPSPYAEWAISQGCKSLYASPRGTNRGAFYTRGTKAQEKALKMLYDKAVSLMQNSDTRIKKCTDSIYVHLFEIPRAGKK